MKQPNILFILADDMGWGDVGYHGAPIRTPNIDRLASEGVELDQHYVCPMCTPTRTSFLTGRHASRFGAHATVPSNAPVLPDGYETVATLLRQCGYDTGLFGKWHLGSSSPYGPNHYGFNMAYGSLAGGVDPYNHRYKRGPFSETWHRNGTLIEERGHVTDLIAREAVRWIEERDSTQPWFCYVPFTAVHVPVKPPQAWLDQYAYGHYDEDPSKDRSFKQYAAYASHMDHAIGQLTEILERLCQRENTLIVFSSDNGAINECPLHGTDKYPGWQEASPRLGSNYPLRGVKAQLYEGGIRTPTIATWRGTLQPGKLEHPVQIVDWMPTFCRLAGLSSQQAQTWDGRDIWPLLTGEQQHVEDRCLYWNFRGGKHLGIRYEGWKLICKQEENDRTIELFNIDEDPLEQYECAAHHPERVKTLLSLMDEQQKHDNTSVRHDVDSPMVG